LYQIWAESRSPSMRRAKADIPRNKFARKKAEEAHAAAKTARTPLTIPDAGTAFGRLLGHLEYRGGTTAGLTPPQPLNLAVVYVRQPVTLAELVELAEQRQEPAPLPAAA